MYLGESTIFLGGDGGVPAGQHRAALMPTAVMSITTSIIMMMIRMTLVMMIVEAAAAGPPLQQRRGERRLCPEKLPPYTSHDI